MATILLVDDEPVLLDVFERLLARAGRTFLTAGSAAAALAVVQGEQQVDVALVDKNLGDGSGLDVAVALKRAQPWAEVILVTGYASLDSAIEAVRIGAYDYVTKPITDLDGLDLKVENALDKVRLRREAEALQRALAASEALHRGVFETASDALLLVGEDGAVEDANPAAERAYGRRRAALRGLGLTALEAPGEAPEPEDGRVARGRHRRADGAEFPVEVASGSLALADRTLRVLSVRDLSERERADARRQELQHELRQAQKMEALGRLAGGVAHDLSNVLAVITGWTELLGRRLPIDAPGAREAVRGISEACQRATGVTRQLLTLSRKKLNRPVLLSLNDVVGEVSKLLDRAVGERITVTRRLEERLWPVLADADQVAQVLLNLGVNARDAMPDGGPLELSTRNAQAGTAPAGLGLGPGRHVVLAVRDGGAGMTPEVLARAFDPLFTTKDAAAGLGLSTVREIARMAGGAVRAESRPGEGAVLEVWLPAAEGAAVALARRGPSLPPRARGERVLLAEDDDALRFLVGQALAEHGYEVVSAANGVEALEAARRRGGAFDLLLTDLTMPRMAGPELADALQRAHPGLRVLFMTGNGEDDGLRARVARGRAELIEKPFTSEALLAHLHRLGGARVRGAGRM
ncbi:MAG: response regulator [Anaeromyxobacteraceae bacterium]